MWSAFVDGRAEKPARAGSVDDTVLIRLINSAEGFPIEIVYAEPAVDMSRYGVLGAQLPNPDMVVTRSRWDVYLPTRYRYFALNGNLDVTVRGRLSNPRKTVSATAASATGTTAGRPLRIKVPDQGVHFAFEKLYANQGPGSAEFSVRYLGEELAAIALALSGVGALLVWIGIFTLWRGRQPTATSRSRVLTALYLLIGAALLLITIAYLQVSPVPAALLTLSLALLGVATWLARLFSDWRLKRAHAALSNAAP